MKNATFLLLLISAILLGGITPSPAADPNESYLRAVMLYDDGMKAAGTGQREAAMGKLKAAQTLIQKISQNEPGWQPALVAYRLQKIGNALQELDEAWKQGQVLVSGTEPADKPR